MRNMVLYLSLCVLFFCCLQISQGQFDYPADGNFNAPVPQEVPGAPGGGLDPLVFGKIKALISQLSGLWKTPKVILSLIYAFIRGLLAIPGGINKGLDTIRKGFPGVPPDLITAIPDIIRFIVDFFRRLPAIPGALDIFFKNFADGLTNEVGAKAARPLISAINALRKFDLPTDPLKLLALAKVFRIPVPKFLLPIILGGPGGDLGGAPLPGGAPIPGGGLPLPDVAKLPVVKAIKGLLSQLAKLWRTPKGKIGLISGGLNGITAIPPRSFLPLWGAGKRGLSNCPIGLIAKVVSSCIKYAVDFCRNIRGIPGALDSFVRGFTDALRTVLGPQGDQLANLITDLYKTAGRLNFATIPWPSLLRVWGVPDWALNWLLPFIGKGGLPLGPAFRGPDNEMPDRGSQGPLDFGSPDNGGSPHGGSRGPLDDGYNGPKRDTRPGDNGPVNYGPNVDGNSRPLNLPVLNDRYNGPARNKGPGDNGPVNYRPSGGGNDHQLDLPVISGANRGSPPAGGDNGPANYGPVNNGRSKGPSGAQDGGFQTRSWTSTGGQRGGRGPGVAQDGGFQAQSWTSTGGQRGGGGPGGAQGGEFQTGSWGSTGQIGGPIQFPRGLQYSYNRKNGGAPDFNYRNSEPQTSARGGGENDY